MNPSQAYKSVVGRSILAQIFNNDELVDLVKMSDVATASSKQNADPRPTYDSTLKAASSDGLFTDTDDLIFTRLQAEQFARSIDVVESRLDAKYEFDTSITFSTTTLDGNNFSLIKKVFLSEILEIPFITYLIDIKFNNGVTIRKSTYNRDLTVVDGYFGNLLSTSHTYTADDEILGINATKANTSNSIGDGIPGSGITLSADTTNLITNIQANNHIGATINLRLLFVREGKIFAGPIRGGNLKINGATQSYDKNSAANVVVLSTIKNWEQIINPYGLRTAGASHRARFPNDGFFDNSEAAAVTKLFKEED